MKRNRKINLKIVFNITGYDSKENKRTTDTTELWFAQYNICAEEKHPPGKQVN